MDVTGLRPMTPWFQEIADQSIRVRCRARLPHDRFRDREARDCVDTYGLPEIALGEVLS
jgi:hypothetical protein